jgi:hypothetical protein
MTVALSYPPASSASDASACAGYLQAAPASDARRSILAWPAYDAARESELVDSRLA